MFHSALTLLAAGLTAMALSAQAPIPPVPQSTSPRPSHLAALTSEPPRATAAFPVQNLRFTSGHGEFFMSSGRLVEVRVGSHLLAYTFKGQGQFTYTSAEALEASSFRTNLKRNTSLKPETLPEGGLRIQESFTSALFWVQSRPLTGLGAAEAVQAPADQAFLEAMLEEFHSSRRRFAPTPGWMSRLQTLAESALNGPSEGFLIAELKGQSETLIHTLLARQPGQESLTVSKLSGNALLSSQPVGWSYQEVPIKPFILSHLDLDLTALDKKTARLKATETYTPTRGGLRLLDLSLSQNLGEDRSLVLKRVSTESGAALPYLHSGGRLQVELPQPTVAYEPITLVFEAQGEILFEPSNAQRWQLGLWSWFPQPDMGAQAYTVHAVARALPPMVPVMPGTWIRRGQEQGLNVLETRIDRPVQFFVVDAGHFTLHEDQRGDRLVRVWAYKTETRNVARLGRMCHQMMAFYEQFLGPFPFEHLNLIQAQDYGFGQAPPGTIYITREAFDPLTDDVARAYAGGVNDRIAHEIAHQYWGHLVKMATYEDQWITEGFAEYCSALAMLNAKGKGEKYYQQMVREWERNAREAGEAASIASANRLRITGQVTEQSRIRKQLMYDKSAFLIYDLHQKLGDKDFFNFLFNIPANIQWRYASTANLLELLRAITGRDHSETFRRYLWGTDMPDGRAAGTSK